MPPSVPGASRWEDGQGAHGLAGRRRPELALDAAASSPVQWRRRGGGGADEAVEGERKTRGRD